MREQIKDKARLQHIYDACELLIQRKQHDSLQILCDDPVKFYGYVKIVEIIGEATYKLTRQIREQNPQIPWKVMEGMRHVLVHDYYRISPEKLWATINDDIPQLKPMIAKLLEA